MKIILGTNGTFQTYNINERLLRVLSVNEQDGKSIAFHEIYEFDEDRNGSMKLLEVKVGPFNPLCLLEM